MIFAGEELTENGFVWGKYGKKTLRTTVLQHVATTAGPLEISPSKQGQYLCMEKSLQTNSFCFKYKERKRKKGKFKEKVESDEELVC